MGRFENKIKPLFASLSCSFGPPDKQLFLADHLESARQHKALGSASLQAASTQPQERVKCSQAPHICIISTCRGTRGTELFIKQICAAAACSERQGLQAVSPQHAHLIKEMAMFTCTHVCTHVLFPGEVQTMSSVLENKAFHKGFCAEGKHPQQTRPHTTFPFPHTVTKCD